MLAYADLVTHAGNEELQRALELSLLACLRDQTLHVHVEGLRGTGKTTIIRAAAGLLGGIRRIQGCPYNCEPEQPHCPLHRGLSAADIASLGAERVPTPFLEVSASAKLGTVVGSIDLARLTSPDRADAALLPGTLARAHRGIVFVDEINRLADTSPELADALLDVMGTKPGRLQIEEAGLPPVVLTCRATVWAASNPDEEPGPLSDIRRQLADRFDLAVAMRRPAEPDAVFAVLADADSRPDAVAAGHVVGCRHPEDDAAGSAVLPPAAGAGRGDVGDDLPGSAVLPAAAGGPAHRGGQEPPRAPGERAARRSAPPPAREGEGGPGAAPGPEPGRGPGAADVGGALRDAARAAEPDVDDSLRMLLARTYCEFQLESLRAVLAWQAASRLAALRAGRSRVTLSDLSVVAPSVLRHRLDPEELSHVLEALGRDAPEGGELGSALAGSASAAGPAVAVAVAAADGPAGPVAPYLGEAGGGGAEGGAAARQGWALSAVPGPDAGGWTAPAAAGRVGDAAGGAAAQRSGLARLLHWAMRARRTGAGAPAAAPADAGANGAAPPDGGRARSARGAAPRTLGDRLADPTRLPPLAPRTGARLLSELPPAEMWTPATPADPCGQAASPRGGRV